MVFVYKEASKSELKAEWKRIAKCTGDDLFFTKKELNYLPEILSHGEQVLCFASGMMEGTTWLIALTNQRIVFLDKGFVYGLKQTIIELSMVASVSGKTGVFYGEINVDAGSMIYQIKQVPKLTVKPFTNMVREAILGLKETSPRVEEPKSHNIVDQLKELSALKSAGVLTEVEFKKAKDKIIGE